MITAFFLFLIGFTIIRVFKWLVNNPWLVTAFAYILGAALGLYAFQQLNLASITAVGLIIITLTWLVFRAKNYRSFFILTVIVAIGGALNGVLQIYTVEHSHLSSLDPKSTYQVYGSIISKPRHSEYSCSFLMSVKQVDGEPKSWGNLWVRVKLADAKHNSELEKLDIGKNVYILCKVQKAESARNFFEFDSQRYLLAKDCGFETYVYHPSYLKDVKSDLGWGSLVNRASGAFTSTIERNLSPLHSQLMISLIYGDRTGSVSDELAKSFRYAGLTHLLVVSGAQVGLLALILFTLLRPLGYPGITGWRGIITAVLMVTLLVFFGLITGYDLSIKRSIIMAGLWLFARVVNRKIHPFTALAQSALIITLPNPLAVLSISFQLSFAATFAVLYGLFCVARYEKNNDKIVTPQTTILKVLFYSVLSSISVSLVLSPILAVNFGQIPVYSVLSNVIAVPLSGLILVWGVITNIGFAALGPVLSAPLKFVMVFLLDLLIMFTQGIAQLPFASGNLEPPGILVIVLYYLGLLLIIEALILKRQNNTLLAQNSIRFALSNLALASIVYFVSYGQTKVVFPYTRSGDAVVIRYQQHLFGFVNCSNSKHFERTIKTLEKSANYLGFNRFSCTVALNHPSAHALTKLKEISNEVTTLQEDRSRINNQFWDLSVNSQLGWRLTLRSLPNFCIENAQPAIYAVSSKGKQLNILIRKQKTVKGALALYNGGALAFRVSSGGKITNLLTSMQK